MRSRRSLVFRLLMIGAMLVAVALVALPCLGAQSPSQPTPRPQAGTQPGVSPLPAGAIPEGHLRVAVGTLLGSTWDPMVGSVEANYLRRFIFDPLVGAKDENAMLSTETGLASDWQEAPDGLSWVFKLRQGIRFHNGDEVTAEDVKFSVDRIMGPKSQSSFLKVMRENVAGIDVVDRYTVRIRTKARFPMLPWYLSLSTGTSEPFVVPKKYVQEKGDDYFLRHPIGSGPYKVVADVPGDYFTLEAVDRHWRVGVPRWRQITFREVPEEGTRIAQLKRGEIDLTPMSLQRVKEVEQAGLTVLEQPGAVHVTLWPMWGLAPAGHPLRNPKVREALNLAINRQEIVKALFAGRGTPSSIYYASSWAVKPLGFDESPYKYPFDPQRARELLREAGYEHPKLNMILYELTIPEGPNLMMTVAGYWKSVGAEITMETYEYSSFFTLWDKGNPKIIGSVAHNGTASRLPLLLPVSFDKMFTPTKGAMSYFDVPKVGELARQALKEPDTKKAMGLVRDMLIGAREAHAAMPIANLPKVWGAGPSVPKDLDFGMIRYSWGEDLIRRR